ncbi:MAG: hypothetical protein VB092_09545 [Oscillospiraceae bacterium]|nr:hypothetical protein [Oscillospiraceae bacterium]
MIKNYFSTLNTNSLLRRLLLLVPTMALINFSIGCYYTCGLGTDPISVFIDGQHVLLGWSYGQITSMNNIILFIVMLWLGRKYMGLGTVATVFLSGPLIDLFEGMLRAAFPPESSALYVKIILLCIGVLGFGIGLGLFVTVGLGIGPFDFLPLWLRDVTKIELKWTRMMFDAFFLITGWLLGGIVGIGTAAGVLLTGPVMSFTIRVVGAPLGRFFGPLHSGEKDA